MSTTSTSVWGAVLICSSIEFAPYIIQDAVCGFLIISNLSQRPFQPAAHGGGGDVARRVVHRFLQALHGVQQLRAAAALGEFPGQGRHRPDAASAALLERAMERLNLSARAYDRILKVARTIADLAGHDTVAAADVAEAINYRSLDRGNWGR